MKYKIVIYGFTGLGDMIEFSPCFRLLRAKFPDSKIVLVTVWQVIEEVFRDSPYLDEILYFDFLNARLGQKIAFVRKLRKSRFDISILPYPSFRREFNLFSRAIGATSRYSFNFGKGTIREMSFLNNYRVNADYSKHNLENNMALMRMLQIQIPENIEYEIPIKLSPIFIEQFRRKHNIDSSKLIVGIHPGSDKRGKERRLPIVKFAEISDIIKEKYDATIIAFFGPHEQELKDEFVRFTKNAHIAIINYGIREVIQLISCCNVFISGDSGLMHIASAMKVPTVAIFGPTNPVFVHPWGVPYELVSLGLPCSPCFVFTEKHPLNKPLIECKIEEKFACIHRIETQQIVAKFETLVSRTMQEKH